MERLFIANRGEIAVRVIRSARELGIGTVVAVSEPDEKSHAARLADEYRIVGPAPATKSYLDQSAVLAAALESGCDAVHPGYGFLSENAAFAAAAIEAGSDLGRSFARSHRADGGQGAGAGRSPAGGGADPAGQ